MDAHVETDVLDRHIEQVLRNRSGWNLDALTSRQARSLIAAVRQVAQVKPIRFDRLAPEPVYPELPDRDKQDLPGSAPGFIGICGWPRSGKDVVADFLIAHYRGVKRVVVSDFIMREVNACLKTIGSGHVITQATKSEPVYRRVLQEWGTARPLLQSNYFAEQCRQEIHRLQEGGTRLVILSGVRSEGDVDLVVSEGGVLWRVVRPGNDYVADHAAERRIEHVPAREILNPVEGDLEPFEQNIVAALSRTAD